MFFLALIINRTNVLVKRIPRKNPGISGKPRFYAALVGKTRQAVVQFPRKGERSMDSRKTGALIAEARKEKGLTQRQLAETLHLSDRTVSKWERGGSLR